MGIIKKTNLNVKIIVPILAVLIMSVAAITILNYFNMESTIYQIVDGEMETAIINLENQMTLTENTIDIVMSQMDKKNLALSRALAEIVKQNPDVTEQSEMERLAKLLDVTEVHVMDEEGVLWWGNIPGYYGFDFKTSEQTLPFLKILEDPSYELAQEPMPNGSLGITFQYTGVARTDQKGLVQVGIGMKVIDDIKNAMNMQNFIKNQKIGQNGFSFIAANGIIEFHPDEKVLNKNVSNENWYSDINSGAGTKHIVIDGVKYYAAYKNTNAKTIVSLLQESEINAHTNTIRDNSIMLAAAAVLFMGIIIVILAASITRPVKDMSKKIKLVANGDLDIELKQKSNDEIGYLSRDFDSLRTMLKKLASDVNRMNDEHKEKNYDYVIDVSQYYGGFKVIVDIINNMAQRRAKETFTLKTSIGDLNNIIHDIDENIKSNAEAASNARELALKTTDYANLSSGKMEQMMNSINDINESSINLSKTIKAINAVASQTNMLAINAAIEAVRAGEAGRSFSALADQIGVLAHQSTNSVNDSTEMLDIARIKTQEGTEITHETVEVIQKMIEQILIVADCINNIAQASHEQEQSINNVRHNVTKIAEIMDIL